jgi:uncharacterized membrane protein
MNTDKNTRLKTLPTNYYLIEKLYTQGYFNFQVRVAALDILYPKHQLWAQWTYYLLLLTGTALVLSGIIYFFAFNWFKLTSFEKFALVEIAILSMLMGTFHFKLNSLIGKLCLLSSSILIGVFLAVFGQIYQTGADSYQLFLAWSIFISIWVVISNFAVLWFILLILLNMCLILFWQQGLNNFIFYESKNMLFSCLAFLNGAFLILREYGYLKGLEWLNGRWLRIVLVLGVLVSLYIPTFMFIVDFHRINYNISIGLIFSLIAHVIFLAYYRYKQPDLWVIATTILSICIILETFCFRIVIRVNDAIGIFFLLTLVTIGIFSFAMMILRSIAKTMGEQNAN